MAKRQIIVSTWRHLGDAIALATACVAVRKRNPEISFKYEGFYQDVFDGLDMGEWDEKAEAEKVAVHYGDYGADEKKAENGNIVEGFIVNIEKTLHIEAEHLTTPVITVGKEEMEWAKKTVPADAVIVNTNCQNCSTTKAYPWWGEVLKRLVAEGYKPILIGGQEERDVKGDFGAVEGVIDLRGKTDIKQLFALAKVARIIISPPSSIIHVGAALCKKCICLTGAREAVGLTKYPTVHHLDSVCVIWNRLFNRHRGCMGHKVEGCERRVEIRGRYYPYCLACISAESIIEEAKRLAKPRGEK